VSDKQWLYDYSDYSQAHLQQLHREAEQERLANRLPRKPGLLEVALNLLTGKAE
jgi:hypothetical protein